MLNKNKKEKHSLGRFGVTVAAVQQPEQARSVGTVQ